MSRRSNLVNLALFIVRDIGQLDDAEILLKTFCFRRGTDNSAVSKPYSMSVRTKNVRCVGYRLLPKPQLKHLPLRYRFCGLAAYSHSNTIQYWKQRATLNTRKWRQPAVCDGQDLVPLHVLQNRRAGTQKVRMKFDLPSTTCRQHTTA